MVHCAALTARVALHGNDPAAGTSWCHRQVRRKGVDVAGGTVRDCDALWIGSCFHLSGSSCGTQLAAPVLPRRQSFEDVELGWMLAFLYFCVLTP